MEKNRENKKISGLLFPVFLLLSWTYYLNDLYIIRFSNSNLTLLWILDAVFYLAVPVVVAWFLHRKGRIDISRIFGTFHPFPDIPVAVILTVFFIAGLKIFLLDFLYRYLYVYFLRYLPNFHFGYGFPDHEIIKPVLIVYASFTAGLLEEFVFRGVLVGGMKERNIPFAVIFPVSILLFSLIHFSNGFFSMFYILIWGIVPVIFYYYTEKLYPLIIAHFLYDLISFLGVF